MNAGPELETAVERVAELLEVRIGLRAEPTVRSRLRRCVQEEAAGRGLDLRRYLDAVVSDGRLFEQLLDRVTVQETAFFRHPEQFATMAEVVLPAIRPPVRFWSAGCANGQEAYSLAMVLQERGLDGSVVATDLSTAALARTVAGRYTDREVGGLSPERIARHLVRRGHGWEVRPALRQRVAVLRHNLLDPLPDAVRSCQVVFCRNVLIYLSRPCARTFLERVADMGPAALFVGSAEAIWPVTDRFAADRVGDVFVHRPVPAPATPPTPATARLAPATGRSGAGVRPHGTHRTGLGAQRPRPQPPGAQPPGAQWPGAQWPGAQRPGAQPARARPRPEPAGPQPPAPVSVPGGAATAELARAGQHALVAGDARSAVVGFRKWTYLAPDDALAHLHLGLALEASGDGPAARRAYEVAHRLALRSDPAEMERAMKGYAGGELLRLLELKHRGPAR